MESDPFDIFDPNQLKRPPVQQLPEDQVRKIVKTDEVQQNFQDDESQGEQYKALLPFQTEIIQQRSQQGCMHQTFSPHGYQRKHYSGPLNAKRYNFKLDPFQSQAVNCIECDQSVLVCAHTSAGKTAIAEYAIATCLKKKARVIYTSPIKALSNQKYRELKNEFEDVGLVTGDVTIDQNSTCLVMTTEILRNMIYRGSEVVREVKWVIFDEVHYMRDKERGVVWQETIILLPEQVKFVFLSATIGNPGTFAKWIAVIKQQPCHVIYTDYRPVPLEHYICPSGGQALYQVVDDKSKFNEANFTKAIETLGQSSGVVGLDKNQKKRNYNQGSDLFKIIKVIIEKRLDPVIIFSFSKKDVETHAKSVCLKYDLTTKIQKERIEMVYENSMSLLEQVDRSLPQVVAMKEIIKKGIGIHHGGLLPIVKEVIQLLFQDGLLKVLFSTQTFSMGLNMPARTVVFTSLSKFDGEKPRWITGSEYIQMSGRAGRRGIDKKGMTILMLDKKMQPEVAKSMLQGKSDDLLSSFYLNYNMLLNSQRLEDIDTQFILARSLLQFQHASKVPTLKQEYKQKLHEFQSISIPQAQEKQITNYYQLKNKLKQYKTKYRALAHTPKKIVPYMCIGRIVRVWNPHTEVMWGLGVCINFHKKEVKNSHGDADFIFDLMVHVKMRSQGNQDPEPQNLAEQGEMVVLSFTLDCIYEILTAKISKLPNDLTEKASKISVKKTLKGLARKTLTSIEIEDNKPESAQLRRMMGELEGAMRKYSNLQEFIPLYEQKIAVHAQVQKIKEQLNTHSGLVLKKEKKAHLRVLKKTEMIEKQVVTFKGNVACQISGTHQILLTTLLLGGFFNDMNSLEIAAILTSLIHQEKSSTERKFTKTPKLRAKLEELLVYAKNIYQVLKQCKMEVEQDQFLNSIKEQLIETTYEWANGANFEAVCKMSETYEGNIIRTLRRLNELLKKMAAAANFIGNKELSQKFEHGAQKIFRGLVSAASLYTE